MPETRGRLGWRPWFTLVGPMAFTMVVVAGFFTQPASAQGQPSTDSHPRPFLEKQVQSVLAAKDSLHAAGAYWQLFKYADAERLDLLRTNQSDSIAIQAAWEQIERTIPEKPDRVVRPHRDGLTRFLGFLEGRARVRTPQWWAEALLDARANRRGNIYPGGLIVSQYAEPQPNPRVVPTSASFDTVDGKAVIRVGPESATVPKDLREKVGADGAEGLREGLSALLTSSHCYVAAYDSVGNPYQLACVDRSTSKLRWIANVWASWQGAFSGESHQSVELTEQGDRVVVFGAASTGFHVEAFRKDDGANLLRFSNYYSGR